MCQMEKRFVIMDIPECAEFWCVIQDNATLW